jgi:hypothetical protein
MVGCTAASAKESHIWLSEDVSLHALKCGGTRRLQAAQNKRNNPQRVGRMQDFIDKNSLL